MAFDLSSAQPAGGFDLGSASVAGDDVEAQRRKFRQSEAKGYDATPGKDPMELYTHTGDVLGTIAEPLLQMASGVGGSLLSAGAGAGAAILDASGAKGYAPEDVRQRMQQALTYEPRTAGGQSDYNPLNFLPKAIGMPFNWMADKYEQATAPPGSSEFRQAGARGSGEAIRQLPNALGILAPDAAAGTQAGLQGSARWLMGKALKPTAQMGFADASAAIQTMLDEGISVSKGGLEKLQNKITTLNDQIKEVISTSGASIDKAAVADRLNALVDKFKQVTPGEDLSTIKKAWNDFMSNPFLEGNKPTLRGDMERPGVETTLRQAAVDNLGPPISSTLEQVAGEQPGRFSDPRSIGVPPPSPMIPVQLAQELKQGTYRALGNKAYGELKGADIESQKTLARALKEDIATAAPEVGPLNAKESKLLNVIDALEHRVQIEGNKNPLGIGLLNPKALPAWFFDRSSFAKSLLARALNATGSAVPGMEAAGPAAGISGSFQADQEARKRRLAQLLGSQ